MRNKGLIPDIEFMRIISVLAVIVYHYFPRYFPFGYLGVDVFFVLSGFVITRSFVSKSPSFKSIIPFYKKRILRLLPALYAVLFITFLLSVLFDPPHSTKNIGQGIIATVTYLANIFYYREIDYFNPFQSESPLLHTWSLSLEEQFYLVFPILFVLTKRPKIRIYVLLSLIVISLSIYLESDDTLYRHYMPQTRVWQLFLGTVLAIFSINQTFKNNLIHYISIVILIAILFFFKPSYPSILIILPLISALIIRPQKNIYHSPVILLLGSLSYSLYLWHQPIIYYSGLLFEKSLFNFIGVLLVTFLISCFSLFYLENYLRYRDKLSTYAGLFLSTCLLLYLGYLSHSTRGLFNIKKAIYSIERNEVNFDYDSLLSERMLFTDSVFSLPVDNNSIVIIGDSKSEDLICSLYEVTGERYLRISQHAMDYSQEYFAQETVINMLNEADKIVFTNTWDRRNISNVHRVIKQISQASSAHIYVLSTANFEDVTSQYFSYISRNYTSQMINKNFNENIRRDWQRQSDELKQILTSDDSLKISWIDKEDCFINENNGILVSNKLTIYDTGHLTRFGFSFFGNWIIPLLNIK